ncbi:MAG TPA: hypothetical protein VHE36_14465 [Sphingomicrobium sp.]|nr:hypothetical protein [Sphingomicrobium sp.]
MAIFFRPALFPYPTGKDCKPGILTARNLQLTADTVGVSLAGKAWQMKDGMPTSSLWSWASGNPVLSLVINKLLPAAVGLALGLFTWSRRTSKDGEKAPEEAGAEKAGEAKPGKPRRAFARNSTRRKPVRARRS